MLPRNFGASAHVAAAKVATAGVRCCYCLAGMLPLSPGRD